MKLIRAFTFWFRLFSLLGRSPRGRRAGWWWGG